MTSHELGRCGRRLVPAVSNDLAGVKAPAGQLTKQFVLVLTDRLRQRPNGLGDVLWIVLYRELQEKGGEKGD